MALAAAPAPEDATSSKIRSLMLLGYPVAELTRGVALLGEAPWSATCVEQGHSVASSIIRKHPKYGKERLTSRIVVQQAVPLFRQDPLDGRIRRAENTLARLQRKRPDRITARHAYCKMLTSEAMKQKAQGRQMPSGVSRFVIKGHGKQWAALPAHRKRVCRDYASDLAKEANDRLQVLVNDTKKSLRELRQLKQRQAKDGHCLRLGRCRFSQADITDFNALYNDPKWTRSYVEDLRNSATVEVCQLPLPVMAVLDQMQLPERRAVVAKVEWLPWMAGHRDLFRDAIVAFTYNGETSYWKFVFAKLNPIMVCLCRVNRLEVAEPWFSVHEFDDVGFDIWAHSFEWDMSEFVYSNKLGFPVGDVTVLIDVVSRQGGLLCADGCFRPIQEWKDLLPQEDVRGAASEPRQHKPKEVGLEPWMEDLFMWEYVRDGGGQASTKPRGGKAGATALLPLVSDDEYDLEDPLAHLEALWEKRKELDFEDVGPEPFVFSVRGGRWTSLHKGVAFDSYRGQARAGDASDFCRLYSLGLSATFSIAAYGDEVCLALCQYWIHKMTYLFHEWAEAGMDDKYVFSDVLLAACEQPDDIRVLSEGASAKLVQRIGSIASLRPRRA